MFTWALFFFFCRSPLSLLPLFQPPQGKVTALTDSTFLTDLFPTDSTFRADLFPTGSTFLTVLFPSDWTFLTDLFPTGWPFPY
jgi:hypothetical protein